MAEAYPAHAMAEPATDIAGAQRVDHREFAAEMRRLRRAPPSVVEVRDRAVEVGECRVAEIYEEDYDLGCKGGARSFVPTRSQALCFVLPIER